ncbi:LysR family transcriptional regulator [Burkholderiaceae bacterium FT117]|uniref:LysR family transcriptional regulator n=1 Tax=Zeimonas sediminis TaxID=2944268 RepID=UPI0023431112|nr:LysR family transcriptional regulator [Zeimonas sediminis]MCM5571563.1 LysR family transcriptional regulator [Zeimonas sediminis]
MTRGIDPLTLRLFVAVCEERNIARAAAREALVASAVSKRIAAVEREIGASLLVRGRRGVAPTAAGEALLRRAREILGAMDRLQAELDEFASGVQGNVRVIASVTALAERLPEDIASFLARYQSVRVSLDEGVSTAIVRAVREGAADLGVLWDVADLEGLQAVPYRSDRLCVVMQAGHPLSGLPAVRFEQTLAYPSIGVTPGGRMEVILRRQAALLGHVLTPRIVVSSLDAARRIAAAGLGLAILPEEVTAPHAGAGGLALVPLSDSWARRQFVVCSRPDSLLSAAARLLNEHLKREALHG